MTETLNTIIQALAKQELITTNEISDGYHTFGELYDHRIVLFLVTAKLVSIVTNKKTVVWRSRKHSDGSEWKGWFIMGIGVDPGTQITYHLNDAYWDDADFAVTVDQAPLWDGHTPAIALIRLKNFLNFF